MQGKKTILNEKAVEQMYRNRMTQAEIAREFRVDKTVIRQCILKLGIWEKRNKGGNKLGRRCISCGELYNEPTMFLGIKRCPKCFSAEHYEPLIPNTKSHEWSPFISGYDIPYHEDNGCPEAEAIVGHPVKCLECPLSECIHVVIANKHCSTKKAAAMVKCEVIV